MRQRHRMHLDQVADDELHAHKADAVGRQPPPAERRGGVGEVEHDPGAGLRHIVEAQIDHLERGGTFIDEALIALGA